MSAVNSDGFFLLQKGERVLPPNQNKDFADAVMRANERIKMAHSRAGQISGARKI